MPEESKKPQPKRENLFVNVLFNVVVPSLLLMKGERLIGIPAWSVLCIALAFPIIYFLHDLKSRGRRNIISIIGFVSILITGGVGLLHLPSGLIAVKEAAVPGIFALVIVASLWTKNPLIKAFLINPDFFEVDKIEKAVAEHGAQAAFERVMRNGTLLLALSFFVSATLNYLLARWIVRSPSGTEAFNVELGKLNMVSYPAIALPATLISMMALWHVVAGIKKHAGLSLEDIMIKPEGAAAADAQAKE